MSRLLVFQGVLLLAAIPGSAAPRADKWRPRLAAKYLDARQKEWFEWPAARAPGGTCVSCHTGLTYLLARPALRRALGESQPTEFETGLRDSLRARNGKVNASEVSPSFKKEPLASQAVGVEAVFAAMFLAGDPANSKAAFNRMWSLQIPEGKAAGAFPWFSLNLDPWEMPESQYFGAALAAIAVGSAGQARSPNIDALTNYLRREFDSQPLHNPLMALWASVQLPAAIAPEARGNVTAQAWRLQQPDGSWTLESLGPWKRPGNKPAAAGGDSYATAFTTFVLGETGARRSRFTRSRKWLAANQNKESGAWAADSMNKTFEPGSMQSGFMRDAATAFAALALVK